MLLAGISLSVACASLSCFGAVVLRRHSQCWLSGLGEGGAPGIQQAEAINAAKPSFMARDRPHNKKLSGTKC